MNKHSCYPLIITLLLPGAALAQDEMEFSFNTWMSQGRTKWRHDASALSPLVGVPTSELDYQGVNSRIAEVGVINHLPAGHDLKLTLGVGSISEGTLVDDDYFSASGAAYYGTTQSGAHRYSRTHSDIDGSGLFYFKGEFSPKDFQINNAQANIRFSFDVHRWEEEYTATGVWQIECTSPGVSCAPAGTVSALGRRVITNKVEWTGVGIAMDSLFHLTDNLGIKLDVTYYPVMSLVNEDTHHLRPDDFAQDPSIRMTGNGTGYDLATILQYRFAAKFSAHLGYRIWQRAVRNKTITFYYPDGTASSADLMDFRTRRDGFIAGVELQFD